MTEYVWSTVRDTACAAFGDSPTLAQERDIAQKFMADPTYVIRSLTEVAAAVAAGRVEAGWPFAHTHIVQHKRIQAVATDTEKRDKARVGALAWVRNVGDSYDLEDEVLSELFGDHGRYKRWPELQSEVLDAWRARVGTSQAP